VGEAIGRRVAHAFIPSAAWPRAFITIVASDLASRFDELQDVRMRVGALPKFPSNALNYNLTWSTDGVINEYCEPCEAIVNGQLRETQPLEELEEFSLDGILYEAFTRPAVSARCARRSRARCAISITAPSATPATPPS